MRASVLLLGSLMVWGCIDRRPSDDPDEPQPTMEPQPTAEPAPPIVEPESPPVRVPQRHRAATETCDDQRAPGSRPEPFSPGLVFCERDSDCQAGRNGRCTGNSHDGWNCTYDDCFEDADCDNVCECEGGFRSDHNICVGGDCRTDADCGPDSFCSPTFGNCGEYQGTVAYYCHTPEDECIDDEDCAGEEQFGDPYCYFDPARAHWACASVHCAGK